MSSEGKDPDPLARWLYQQAQKPAPAKRALIISGFAAITAAAGTVAATTDLDEKLIDKFQEEFIGDSHPQPSSSPAESPSSVPTQSLGAPTSLGDLGVLARQQQALARRNQAGEGGSAAAGGVSHGQRKTL